MLLFLQLWPFVLYVGIRLFFILVPWQMMGRPHPEVAEVASGLVYFVSDTVVGVCLGIVVYRAAG